MYRWLPEGYVDVVTYNIKEILQLLQKILGMLQEGW